MHNHLRQGFSINNQRVLEWVAQQTEALRAPMTTRMRNNRAPSTAVINRAWYQAPMHQTLPMDEALEDIAFMATTRAASPIQQSAIHGSVNEQPVCDTPCAPLMRTIPLPSVAEELDENPLMSTIANTIHPIQELENEHPIGRPESREYPPTPMMRTIALPLVGDAPDALLIPTANRHLQTLRHHFDDAERWLNPALRYQDSIRPVVKPVLSDMLPYPGHRWGAWDQEESCVGELNIHFAYNMAPATNPPLTRMRLARPFGGKLVVTPTRGNQFVSMGDVQNIVVAWMRWEQPHLQEEGLRLTSIETARARDGTTISVEVWVWRGLTRARGETDLWEIHL